MSQNDGTPQILKDKSMAEYIEAIKTELETMLSLTFNTKVRTIESQVKSVLNALEVHQQSVDMSIRELNMKIGAIAGHQKRQEKTSTDFNSIDDAIAFANRIRKENGLPEIKLEPVQ
ncbi:MAG: hypothetical protein ACREAG_08810 [Nitrosopumilaceae archaeon]